MVASKIKKKSGKVWKVVAERITGPRQNLAEVNLSRLDRFTKDGEIVVIPGKLLAYGNINHKVIVGALSFSQSAKKKVEAAGGKCMTLEEIAEKYQDGKKVRIIG